MRYQGSTLPSATMEQAVDNCKYCEKNPSDVKRCKDA